MTLIVTRVLHPHNLFSHTKKAVCVYCYSLAGQKCNCPLIKQKRGSPCKNGIQNVSKTFTPHCCT